ncbi:MAG: TRAP transporter substrate-binding protein [Burkholderiales bacterium]|nr:TRAP transporter substrate-binding protein [Burkholderiales bacterium]
MSVRSAAGHGALLAAALVVAAAPVAAQQKPPVALRYTTGAPPKTPWVTQLERLQAAVAEETKGTLKIDGFIGAQLGNEQDTMQQVARGRIDMGGFSTNAVAIVVPELTLLVMPFYFRSVAESDCTLDALTKPLADLLGRRGLQFLSFSDVGVSDLAGKRPFVVPADVKGIKAASYGTKMSTIMWNTLGANSSPMGITEWAPAFQSGAIDTANTPSTFYVPSGLNKVAPVLSRLEMWSNPAFVLMNKGIYDRLAPEHREALARASSRTSAAENRKELRAFEAMVRGVHEKAGGQIANVTPAQREEWRKVMAPAWPQMVREIGGESEALFRQIEAARKSCEARS